LTRIRLIHWNATEARQKASILESAGYEVDYVLSAPQTLKELRNNPAAAVVIDLSRLPSQGRDIAINIRHAKATRNIPIIFVEGDPQKVNQIKTHLPDALYTDYNQIRTAIEEAITHPPKLLVIPKSVFEPYKHTPLAKKIGIKPNTTLTLINPPKDFTKTLGTLPQGVTIQQTLSLSDLIILFTETQEDLQNRIGKISAKLESNGKLWIAWPKKASLTATDVTQASVRKTGLALGLVDYKVASIDAAWTGLLFAKRKPKKASKNAHPNHGAVAGTHTQTGSSPLFQNSALYSSRACIVW
jgi:CheY-like chemotaxis protein